ncbi:hypothetical protein D3C87_1984070 [compost metagenome]
MPDRGKETRLGVGRILGDPARLGHGRLGVLAGGNIAHQGNHLVARAAGLVLDDGRELHFHPDKAGDVAAGAGIVLAQAHLDSTAAPVLGGVGKCG